MALSTTFFVTENIAQVGPEQIEMLKKAAVDDPLKRSRLCLHKDHNDQVQEMIITLRAGSYVRPHRHSGKSESFHIIDGKMAVVIFDDSGGIRKVIWMGKGEGNDIFLYRINDSFWHSVVPLSDVVVFHETASGPFVEGEGEFADWSPDYSDVNGTTEFVEMLEKKTAVIK